MLIEDNQSTNKIFSCSQCPKVFATRSNLKRHMENPNIHNIPYIRSRDQKRWKGHSKKVISKEETTESNNDRMRKWRSENREKNRQNDLRCRVYRLARQKFGNGDSFEKQGFVREEISRRLGRRVMIEQCDWKSPEQMELPFHSTPQQKIELPSIDQITSTWSLPHLSRRTSSSSVSSDQSQIQRRSNEAGEHDFLLPPMKSFLPTKPNNILDEFVGVVLNYVDNQ